MNKNNLFEHLESFIEILCITYVCEKDRDQMISVMTNVSTQFSGLDRGYLSTRILATFLDTRQVTSPTFHPLHKN